MARQPAVKLSAQQKFQLGVFLEKRRQEYEGLSYSEAAQKISEALEYPIAVSTVQNAYKALGINPSIIKSTKAESDFLSRVDSMEKKLDDALQKIELYKEINHSLQTQVGDLQVKLGRVEKFISQFDEPK